ncbi:MAG: 50S ribosomal protein L25 [Tissierellia bacterium]|nr:50S ribosomal protein L25 [Tissierellia bacterium]
MSEIGILKIEKRENPGTRSSKQLRRAGYLPGNISSRGKDALAVSVKADELRRSLNTYGRNALFNLEIGDQTVTGMVKDIQLSPVKGNMLHVDFQEVSLSEEIRVDLDITLVGTEELEHRKLMALRQVDIITVRGLPQDIPNDIVVDLSNIDKVENVYLKDVEFPEGITPEGDLEQVLISVVDTQRIVEEEEGEEDEETVVEEVETEGEDN